MKLPQHVILIGPEPECRFYELQLEDYRVGHNDGKILLSIPGLIELELESEGYWLEDSSGRKIRYLSLCHDLSSSQKKKLDSTLSSTG